MITSFDQDLHDIAKEHNQVVIVERLTHHIQRIREGMDEMKVTMREMAAAIAKLAVIEERQNQDRAAMERAFNAIDNLAKKHDHTTDRIMTLIETLENSVDELKAAEASNKQVRTWVFGLVTIIGMAVLYTLLSKIGLST